MGICEMCLFVKYNKKFEDIKRGRSYYGLCDFCKTATSCLEIPFNELKVKKLSFKDSFYGAFLALIKENYDSDAVEVTDVKEETESGGYCETCWYDTQVVEVHYVNGNGAELTQTISENLSDLINRLVKE